MNVEECTSNVNLCQNFHTLYISSINCLSIGLELECKITSLCCVVKINSWQFTNISSQKTTSINSQEIHPILKHWKLYELILPTYCIQTCVLCKFFLLRYIPAYSLYLQIRFCFGVFCCIKMLESIHVHPQFIHRSTTILYSLVLCLFPVHKNNMFAKNQKGVINAL